MSAAQDQAMIDMLKMPEFNHQPQWTQAKAPKDTRRVTGHRRFIGNDEETLINAYGNNAAEIIVLASDFGNAPEKFDKFVVNGDKYTVHDVKHQMGFDGYRLFYRCFCRGD